MSALDDAAAAEEVEIRERIWQVIVVESGVTVEGGAPEWIDAAVAKIWSDVVGPRLAPRAVGRAAAVPDVNCQWCRRAGRACWVHGGVGRYGEPRDE